MALREKISTVQHPSGWLVGLLLLAGPLAAWGQRPAPDANRWDETVRPLYAGIEGSILVNVATRLTPSGGASLGAADKLLEPRPALLLGYALTPRFGLEAALQLLPVTTGFSYQQATSTGYIGFSSAYSNDYFYVPLRGLVRVLDAGHRLRLSILAGGGPAFTDLQAGLPITPNGTSVVSVTNTNGSVTTSSYTQQILQEKTHFAVFEAGLRGSWQVVPRLSLDLTVRHLWALDGSVRDLRLEVSTPGEHLATTLTTPVRGIVPAGSIRYAL